MHILASYVVDQWLQEHAQKGSISSFLGATLVRTSSCQVCSAGVLWEGGEGGGVSTNIRSGVLVLLSPIFGSL